MPYCVPIAIPTGGDGVRGPSLIAVDALTELSALTGSEFRSQRQLPGGEQTGAELVTDATGRLLVVKRQPESSKAERLLKAFPVIRDATGRGWPAAQWLWAGRLTSGTAFLVQKYVVGEPVSTIDTDTITAIVDANSRQAGLAHPDAFDDSAQLTAVVRSHPWKEAVANRSRAGAALIRHGDAVLGTAGWPALPAADVVHVDYSSSNMILSRDGVVFIDCETVGRGTRVRDLADLYRQCFIYPDAEPAAVDVLRSLAVTVEGPNIFAACVIGTTYNNLAWWVENKTTAEFDIACRRAYALFETCEALCR